MLVYTYGGNILAPHASVFCWVFKINWYCKLLEMNTPVAKSLNCSAFAEQDALYLMCSPEIKIKGFKSHNFQWSTKILIKENSAGNFWDLRVYYIHKHSLHCILSKLCEQSGLLTTSRRTVFWNVFLLFFSAGSSLPCLLTTITCTPWSLLVR